MTPNTAGLEAARAYAKWHLGHDDWADQIINAYLNPEAVAARLEREKASFGGAA